MEKGVTILLRSPHLKRHVAHKFVVQLRRRALRVLQIRLEAMLCKRREEMCDCQVLWGMMTEDAHVQQWRGDLRCQQQTKCRDRTKGNKWSIEDRISSMSSKRKRKQGVQQFIFPPDHRCAARAARLTSLVSLHEAGNVLLQLHHLLHRFFHNQPGALPRACKKLEAEKKSKIH